MPEPKMRSGQLARFAASRYIHERTVSELGLGICAHRPANVPPWFDAWTAPKEQPDPDELLMLREHLTRTIQLEELREDIIRCPPQCVLQIAGENPYAGTIGVHVASQTDTSRVLWLTLAEPFRNFNAVLGEVQASFVRVLGYHQGLTPLVMRALLRPLGDA